MHAEADSACLPGDVVGVIDTEEMAGPKKKPVRIGPGLMQSGENQIIATKSGTLKYKEKHQYWWVDNHTQKKYVPSLEDLVVGVIVGKAGESFMVDLGSAGYGKLSFMAFEGATKKNRPKLVNGSIVYARVISASKDMDPELECMSLRKRADGFGELTGGYVFKCSLHLARELIDPKSFVLAYLGTKLPYEIAVGLNGKVWVKAS